MSMRWKLRKDKLRDDAPAADPSASAEASPASAEAPPAPAEDAVPDTPSSVFDLSGSAFAPVSSSPTYTPAEVEPVEDEPVFDAPSFDAPPTFDASDAPTFDATGTDEADPRFVVDDDVLSFLTSPPQEDAVPASVADEMAHANAGPQGVVVSADAEEDTLSAFAPYRPATETSTALTAGADEFAHLDAHVSDPAQVSPPSILDETVDTPALEAMSPVFDADAPVFALPPTDAAPVFTPDRESVAPGLVSQDDGGLPRVAPFVIDLPSSATPVSDGPHRLVLRLGNLSATYDLAKEITTIGRPDSITQNYPDIEIELDDGVSRRHAEIRRAGERFAVVDMGSTNGTILNGEMLAPQQPAFLAHGDRIRVGERTEIVFE